MADNKTISDSGTLTLLSGFLFIALLVYLSSIPPFSKSFNIIINSYKYDVYSYIIVILFEFFILLFLYFRNEIRINLNLSMGKIIIFFLYLIIGGFLLTSAEILEEYKIQLLTASIISIIIASLYLLIGSDNMRKSFPLILATLLLIPLPRSYLEIISIHLSRIVGKHAALLTSSNIRILGDRVLIDYGKGYFEIVYACSGIISITSILALFPLALYVTRNIKSIKIRFISIFVSLLVGATTAYVGNLLRITITIYAARHWGEQAALQFFHSSPSIIYSSIATILSILILYRFDRKYGEITNHNSRSVGFGNNRLFNKLKLIMIVVLILFSITFINTYISNQQYESIMEYTSVSYLEQNIINLTLYNFTKISYREVFELREYLGASKVYYFIASTQDKKYMGYIELAPTPAAFHDWTICLEYQGYKVYSKWDTQILNNTVYIYQFGRSNENNRILAVITRDIPVKSYMSTEEYYVRISIFIPNKNDYISYIEEFIKYHLKTFYSSNNKNNILNLIMLSYMFKILIIITSIYIIISILTFIIKSPIQYR